MDAMQREEVVQALPYARRFARALTKDQARGDAIVARALQDVPDAGPLRMALYASIARLGRQDGEPGPAYDERALLLLTALEDVDIADAAAILDLDTDDAERMLADAKGKVLSTAATDVLIIEDEPLIAMDLAMLVQDCGHRVIGTAASEAEAVALAARQAPGLILADINLGTGGSGVNAVARILTSLTAPVIFVTAYPERLLTGKRVEPAFVVTKPFEPLTLAIATYQAVSGGVTVP